ncbi:MAG: type II toxin-antitoxin system PemK/MazF family toxin [Deltaproteobacteria bacterium]|nr:type II toxin-antitoxin system PemK/MazF family toxin [Deltaproteobacteria bacterium]
MSQGDVWWADLGEPRGSEPAYRRPVVIVQCDALNRSRLATVLCIPVTTQLKWAAAPGNVVLKAKDTGLNQDSVANVSQLTALDRVFLDGRIGRVGKRDLQRIFDGLDVALGR